MWPSPETLDHLFAMEHMGNYVIDRDNGNKKIWESMPIYVRAGMHLLFVSGRFLDTYPSVEKLLVDQSIKRKWSCSDGEADFRWLTLIWVSIEGKLYDTEGPTVLPHIQSFIDTYQLPLNELLVQDLTQYPVCTSTPSRIHPELITSCSTPRPSTPSSPAVSTPPPAPSPLKTTSPS